MVPPPRLERGTPRSTIWCSNQLSYGGIKRREPKSKRSRLQAFARAPSSVARRAGWAGERAFAEPDERVAQAFLGDALCRLDGARARR
jgi:hypothetical protein